MFLSWIVLTLIIVVIVGFVAAMESITRDNELHRQLDKDKGTDTLPK
jgi:F0F1-type ATP synthase assembly protein I